MPNSQLNGRNELTPALARPAGRSGGSRWTLLGRTGGHGRPTARTEASRRLRRLPVSLFAPGEAAEDGGGCPRRTRTGAAWPAPVRFRIVSESIPSLGAIPAGRSAGRGGGCDPWETCERSRVSGANSGCQLDPSGSRQLPTAGAHARRQSGPSRARHSAAGRRWQPPVGRPPWAELAPPRRRKALQSAGERAARSRARSASAWWLRRRGPDGRSFYWPIKRAARGAANELGVQLNIDVAPAASRRGCCAPGWPGRLEAKQDT